MRISDSLNIPEEEIELNPIRAQGSGGQNVNKVASAVHLRFDVRASSLPEEVKRSLLRLRDRRISKEGVLVIKAQQHRRQEQNRDDALRRLASIVRRAVRKPRARKPTRPSRAARQRRMDEKTRRGRTKRLRGRPDPGE